MKATEIFNKQIKAKAENLLKTDFDELHDNFQSTLQFTVQQVANGCVESFQHVKKLIQDGANSIPFDELSESIQEFYLKIALNN